MNHGVCLVLVVGSFLEFGLLLWFKFGNYLRFRVRNFHIYNIEMYEFVNY